MIKTIVILIVMFFMSFLFAAGIVSAEARFISGDLQGQGATGEFSMETFGKEQTKVIVNLNGFSAHTSHPSFIRLGDCANPGSVKFELNTIKTNDNNKGSSTTIVDDRLESFEDGNHVITVHHDSSAGSDKTIACGDISAALAPSMFNGMKITGLHLR